MNLPRMKLDVAGHELMVYVAANAEERALGLMHRRDLPEGEGMLFVCDECDIQRFWMKDTPLPLSVAFLDQDGTILQIEDLQPHDLSSCSSEHPVRYVLEVNQGWFDDRGVSAGHRIAGPIFLVNAS